MIEQTPMKQVILWHINFLRDVILIINIIYIDQIHRWNKIKQYFATIIYASGPVFPGGTDRNDPFFISPVVNFIRLDIE